ncbi:arginase family protein [Rhizobiaceae bacterium BDR2-2]|uniref:Arginase family protein n=1 Tax=Ectorhizobium quercum TaxID=2965071 RepID=A0AAE3N121_9HYPH|nr:arginase family protein [Ectorhizobium quercum]MCX8997936.1 arginase family protein [Ectorhizobium quercum]
MQTTNLSAAEPASLYTRPPTFMDTPYTTDATGAGAAILGCPFDCGIHPFRIGARQGPASIREQSGLVRRFHPERADFDVLKALDVVDCGDVRLTSGRIDESFAAIEEAAFRIAAAGAVPIGLGGDGSVSLPLVRAASRVHPGLIVLHIDSHTDAYPADEAYPYDASTQFTHAALEQRIRTGASYHVGLRGTTMRGGVHEHGRGLGYNLVTLEELWKYGPDPFAAKLKAEFADNPVYLSWDMDVFDPSCAPGVCTPVWGGLSAREGMMLMRALSGLNIVAADVNTVSPPHDVKGMTAFLAAAMIYEILLLLLDRPGREPARVSA